MKPLFFNAHHAPIGAFATFTLGSKGASGGLGLELGRPAAQSIHIGVESDRDGVFQALPFFAAGQECGVLQQFDPAAKIEAEAAIEPFADASIDRVFRLCSDTWRAGGLRFTIYSPTGPVPDPKANPDDTGLRRALLPAVVAELEIDNSASLKPRRAYFGFSGNEGEGMRFISDEVSGVRGVGQGRSLAICTKEPAVRTGIGFCAEDVLDALATGDAPGGLGNTALLVFDAPAGRVFSARFAICFFRAGVVTAGIDASYFYSRCFTSIDRVAGFALDNFPELKAAAVERDRQVDDAPLSSERKFMLAHAIRSYYGSTQLLDASDGPLWVVNEGEYRMINTLDLTIDHLFHELAMNPWTVRNVLDRYAARYSFHDAVRGPGERQEYPGGIGFTHDMGVANVFAPAGQSSYERPGHRGLFSYMTHEQLLNWTICAAVYALRTGDTAWVRNRKSLLLECHVSLINRDHPEEMLRSGFMREDSSKCRGGGEITTYDSLDPSLGRARGNTYVAMKRWAAFVLLGRLFDEIGCTDAAAEAAREARRAAAAITSLVDSRGFIPALAGEPATSITLSIAEALVYPWFAGCGEVYGPEGAFAPLIAAIKYHFTSVLSSGLCRCADGGWKMSSTSDITWLSKLYLFRYIATEILGITEDGSFIEADRAHCGWLLDEKNAVFAWSDQFKNGEVVGSRYYPRGVTAVLWLGN